MDTRITEDYVDRMIETAEVQAVKMGKKTTVVHVTLRNGFEIVESAACVDPANYDHEVGTKLALERVKNRIYLLEGYVLQSSLGPGR